MVRIDITINHVRVYGEENPLESMRGLWLINMINLKTDPCHGYAINFTKEELSAFLALLISNTEVTRVDLDNIGKNLRKVPEKFRII